MKKFTSLLTVSFLGKLPKPFTFFTLFICFLLPEIKSQSARLDQWQKIDAAWEYGNLNRRHSNYTEGESVPYRIFVGGLTPGTQATIFISFDITGTNHSPVKHGIDYLTSFDASFPPFPAGPFNDATVYGDPPNSFTVPAGPLDIEAIPAPTNLTYLAGASQGDMILNGGTIDEIIYTDEGDPSVKNAKATVRIKFTPDAATNVTDVVFLYGGHLARDEDYGAVSDDDGAGGIHGSPYHMRLASITGNQDRSVQVGPAVCDLPVEGSCEPDAKCETTAGGGTAHFDLTACSSIGSDYTDITWYDSNDDPIADPTDFVAADGDVVYAVLSNDCGLSDPINVTLHVNSLPTVTCPGNSAVCISAAAFPLAGASPSGGTYSGIGVSGGNFDPAVAGVGPHTITYTYSDGNSCSNTCSFTITVNDLPVVSCPGNSSVCISTAAYALTGATPLGGTYSGAGVSAGSFNPATAGVGPHTITYSYTDGNTCNNTCSFIITVNALPVMSCPGNSSVCINIAAYPLTGATPGGGTYSGEGVSGGNFNPATAGVGPHTITYTYTDGNTCSNTCTFTITVKELPTFGTITPTATCSGTSNGTITLASCQANTNYQLKRCSDGYNVQGVRTCLNGTVIWTGLAAGCYYIVATNTSTTCTNTSSQTTVIGATCNTTLTQGFYGNLGGKDCNNKTAIEIIQRALGMTGPYGPNATGGTNKLFGNGCKSFTLKTTDLTGNKPKIFIMLPGGTTPAVLGCVPASGSGTSACLSGTALYDCKASWTYVPIQNGGSKDGSINNVLLAQTMSMFFNLSNSATLGTVKIEGTKLTFNILACGSSTPGVFASVQYIPCTVFNYLNANYASAGHPNINDLYDLANKVLGGVVTTITPSDMNAALNAINVGFDKGKALMSQEIINCSAPVTRINSETMNEVTNERSIVTVYPNPFNDQVRFVLQTDKAGKASLEVFNMLGQKVKTVFEGQLFANTPQTVEYKVPALAPASNLIYIFRINGKQVTGKLINIKN